MKLADRATIANMAPEYGATMGFFPIDDETLRYLRLTGRSDAEVQLVERYSKEQGLFRTDARPDAGVHQKLELDLSTVEPSLAGPKRPQDRVPLDEHEGIVPASLARRRWPERGFAPGRSRTLAPHGHGWSDNGHSRADRPRRCGDRGDHQLHQHQQSVGDDRRRSGGQEGRRSRD